MRSLIVAGVFCLAITTVSQAGYEFVSKVSDGNGSVVSSAKGLVDGPKAKIEFVSGNSGEEKPCSYMLSRDGGKNVYMVDPDSKSYVKFDIDKLATQVGNFMNAAGPFMKLKFSEPEFKTVLDERGPEMFGLPTRHMKTELTYTVSATVFGHSNKSSISRKDEIWLTKALHDSGMKIWTQQREVKTGNENVDKVIAAENRRMGGIPLKVISVTTTRDSDGTEHIEKSVTEITSLKKVQIPAKEFEVPADYSNKTDEVKRGFQAFAGSLQERSNDSEKDADYKDGESAGKAVGGLLNGLFGGKK